MCEGLGMSSVMDVMFFAVRLVLFGIVFFYWIQWIFSWIQWIRENRTQDERDRDDVIRTRHEMSMERKEVMKANDELLKKIEKLENSVSELQKVTKEPSKPADKVDSEVEKEEDFYAVYCTGRIGWVLDLWYGGDSDDNDYPDLWTEGAFHTDVQQYDTIEEAMQDAKRLKAPTNGHHPPQVIRVQLFKSLQEEKKPEIKANPHLGEDQKKDSPEISRFVIVQKTKIPEVYQSWYWGLTSQSEKWVLNRCDALQYRSMDTALSGLYELYKNSIAMAGVRARQVTHYLMVIPYHEA